MPHRRLIIDGYSLLHRDPSYASTLRRSITLARQQLVRTLEPLAGILADQVTIVFDGVDQGGRGEGYESKAIELIFSPAHHTADTVIERLVHEDPRPSEVLVVSSDRRERETASAAGAQTLSCGDFIEQCESQRKEWRRQTGSMKGKTPRSTLGDFFPGDRD